jgi:hypothetical protein
MMTADAIMVFQRDGGVWLRDRSEESMAPSPSATTHYSHSFRGRVVLSRVRQRTETSSTAGPASTVTISCMKDGWRLSKRQSSTRTPVRAVARRDKVQPHARVGGACLSSRPPTLPQPYYPTVLCPPCSPPKPSTYTLSYYTSASTQWRRESHP